MKQKLNVRLLRRVKRHILAEPRRIKMSQWFDKENPERNSVTAPPCGTTACINGWGLLLSGKRLRKHINYFDAGCKLFGITGQEALRLFHVEEWPDEFQNYDGTIEESGFSSTSPTAAKLKKNAKIAAARIEHFITTRE